MSTIRATYVQHGSSSVPNITLNASGQVIVASGIVSSGTFAAPSGTAAAPGIYFDGDTDTGLYSPGTNQIALSTSGTAAVTVDASQRVGIGTTSPDAKLVVAGSAGNFKVETDGATINFTRAGANYIQAAAAGATLTYRCAQHIFTGSSLSDEHARIDSSGRLLVGTSSSPSASLGSISRIVAQGYTGSDTNGGVISLQKGETASNITTDELIGVISFNDSQGYSFARIDAFADANAGTGDYPGRLVFSTTADGASSPTERMRIDKSGVVYIGTTNSNPVGGNVAGTVLSATGNISVSRDGNPPVDINRKTNDGSLVRFHQDGVEEGNISVSGTTVSYNGAHLSRWSQLPSGAERTEILRGSVLSNIDEMCEWGDEDNEQLNRMKVSDVEGDKNVSGVFQAWDDDDDTYTNDFYCAMTGDFIIRIGAGVTVERGDLLMSAGDGTAKPQDDDIIRSKTIAKVTSTNVTCTYTDGSYCVPCVLMAC